MKTSSIVRSLTCAATLVAAHASLAGEPGSPDMGEPQKRMLAASDGHAINNAIRLLEPGQVLRLVIVARQYATAESCDGFEVDGEKFRKVMNDIVAPLASKTQEGQNNLPVDAVMSAYSTSLGGHLAVAAYDKGAYCAAAAGLRKTLEAAASESVLIWK